jgi:colanic acid/amylovoran biosynthesis glycosyltransferase
VTEAGKPTVVVFSDHLLYPSETFIRAQAQALRRFTPVYAGSRRVPGLTLPEDRTFTIRGKDSDGRLEEAVFKLFGSAPKLADKLAALKPVLLHAHHGANALRALPLAEKLRIPLVATFHGSDATATNLRHLKPYFGHRRYLANKEKLQKKGTLFIAVSEFIRRKLLEQGFPEEKVVVHYIGVDTKAFQPSGSEHQPLILFVGRLVERKGAEFAIRAAAEVQRELPEAELMLIGDGPQRASLELQAKESLRRYRFLGVRPPEEVREWMSRASVFCAPSVKTLSGEEEAFGIVYAEAQAMGKPVVAFHSGGVSEVVAHGRTGFLAPERDWRALAQQLSVLLRDPELRKQFGLAGRERMVRLFDLGNRTEALEAIYSKLLGMEIPESDSLVHREHKAAVASGCAGGIA